MAKKNTSYRVIYDQLRRHIFSGHYRPGDKLPTEMELATTFGVSRATGGAALKALEHEGLVSRSPRSGTIVTHRILASQNGNNQRLIAWIQPINDLYASELLRACQHAAHEAGYSFLFQLTDDTITEEKAIQQVRAIGVSGIMLFPRDGKSYNIEVLRLIVDKFPLVLLDRYLRGVDCGAVYSDNVNGARDVIRELINAGHRNICAVSYNTQGTTSIEDRLEGYTLALTDAGIAIDRSHIYIEEQYHLLYQNEPVSQSLVEQFAEYLRNKPEITSIFATNGLLAEMAMRAALYLELAVPEQLSIVCIDAVMSPLQLTPLFTYGGQQTQKIGETGIELLLEQIAGSPPRQVVLPMKVVSSNSVMPPYDRTTNA
ncbi:GntR family transcriptional regulator [Dictyobacter kobayashii]|uniref:Transcriptional regulator n=1 Tax=Dictyobacter kobayashii TaxID=2014872 RepID=A0A402ADG0_9CHLR|nr:GntR family transcriptional regulator [Dictyobacter kobayashii]GCE17128.1 transcriptional regulator [Dictyobacter kobayashii]